MPGFQTAATLIELVRQEAQVFDTGDVTDGYPADLALSAAGNNILPLLNQGLRKYLATGFNKCYFTYAITAGTREYLVYRGMGRVESAYLVDDLGKQQFIEQTSVADLDRLYFQTWRNRKSARPLGFYMIGTRAFGLDAEPTKDWTLKVLADSQVVDMAVSTDIPARIIDSGGSNVLAFDGSPESALPEQFHTGLAYYAAGVLKHRMGDHSEGDRLMGEFQEQLDELKAFISSRVAPRRTRLTVRRGGNDGMYRGL